MVYTSSEIKAMVAGYFRYKRQCQVVAFEASDKLRWSAGEPADVLVITESRVLYEIEVKISLSDLKHDKTKSKHHFFEYSPNVYPVNRFYFAVPEELTNKALDVCKEIYPYAGLLSISKFPFNSAAVDFGVREDKSPRILNARRLSTKEIVSLVKEQSATLCRLARDKANIESKYLKVNHELQETRKLLKLSGVSE